jgi:hypothetical protein
MRKKMRTKVRIIEEDVLTIYLVEIKKELYKKKRKPKQNTRRIGPVIYTEFLLLCQDTKLANPKP